MKKYLYCLILLALVFGMSPLATAQTQDATTTPAVLPAPGLTPDSPFYFFDGIGEAFQRFFTFNPEAKARLEIKFVAERVSEIKVMIGTKGAQDKGVSVAEASLQDSLNRAAQIVAKEKANGKDVNELAGALDDEIGQNKALLTQTFEDQKSALDTKAEELKSAISAARTAGDSAKADALTKEMQSLKDEKNLLDKEKHNQEDAIDSENAKLEDQMNSKDDAAKKIEEVQKGKTEIIAEAAQEGIDIPPETFKAFDYLLAKAQAAFDSGNYEDAKSFAKQMKKSLRAVEKTFENLKEAKSNEEEINTDEQNLLQESAQAQDEKVRGDIKKAQERLKEVKKNAKEETKNAEEQLKGDQNKNQRETKKIEGQSRESENQNQPNENQPQND